MPVFRTRAVHSSPRQLRPQHRERQLRSSVRGTYICIEGPQFSTRAESELYRSWGADVIGMTAMPEAKLAREAELPYVTLALATDYDCWREAEEAVSVEAILKTLLENSRLAGDVLRELAKAPPELAASPARGALKAALVTSAGHIDPSVRQRLAWLGPL